MLKRKIVAGGIKKSYFCQLNLQMSDELTWTEGINKHSKPFEACVTSS